MSTICRASFQSYLHVFDEISYGEKHYFTDTFTPTTPQPGSRRTLPRRYGMGRDAYDKRSTIIYGGGIAVQTGNAAHSPVIGSRHGKAIGGKEKSSVHRQDYRARTSALSKGIRFIGRMAFLSMWFL